MRTLPTLVQAIHGVWHFTREAHHRARTQSTAGHLVHYVVSGAYVLTIDSRPYEVAAGDVITYYNVEDVVWVGNEVPVEFFSVGFLAPTLPPLPVAHRVIGAKPGWQGLFEELELAYNSAQVLAERLRGHALLNELLSGIYGCAGADLDERCDPDNAWWDIEQAVYERDLWRPSLKDLCAMAGVSPGTLTALCRKATGTTPVKRIANLRMRYARSLLQFTPMSVTEVALHLGYPRMHEFSREYARRQGHPPSSEGL